MKYLTIIVVALFLSQSIATTYAQSPTETPPQVKIQLLQEMSAEELIEHYANQYNTSATTLKKVMKCESGGVQHKKGDSGNAHGTFQFWAGTWSQMTKEMGETLNINSQQDQVKVAAWAFSKGYGNHWTAYRALMNGGTYTFYSKKLKRWYTVYCK